MSQRARPAASQLITRLRRFGLALCHNGQAADDLVQATLERAIIHADQRDPERDPLPWLMGIMHNLFVSERRQATRQTRHLQDWTDVAPVATSGTAESRLELQQVLGALMQLPEDQREAIWLVSVEGLSTDAAAARLGLPVGTLRSRLARGRDRLRIATERQTHEQSGRPPHIIPLHGGSA